jgi:hypothetical protein
MSMEGNNPKDITQKTGVNGIDHETCLVLSTRQISWISAALLLLFFFVFMTGYFIGHQRSLRSFSTKLDQESFADRIYSSLYALYDKGDEEDADEQDDSEEQENAPGEKKTESLIDAAKQPAAQAVVENSVTKPIESAVSKTYYYAEIAGFGSKVAAEKFAQRLHAKNIKVQINKRQSKTVKGKEVVWYQAVTDSFNSKKQLLAVVARLKQEDHLKNVRIVVKS